MWFLRGSVVEELCRGSLEAVSSLYPALRNLQMIEEIQSVKQLFRYIFYLFFMFSFSQNWHTHFRLFLIKRQRLYRMCVFTANKSKKQDLKPSRYETLYFLCLWDSSGQKSLIIYHILVEYVLGSETNFDVHWLNTVDMMMRNTWRAKLFECKSSLEITGFITVC